MRYLLKTNGTISVCLDWGGKWFYSFSSSKLLFQVSYCFLNIFKLNRFHSMSHYISLKWSQKNIIIYRDKFCLRLSSWWQTRVDLHTGGVKASERLLQSDWSHPDWTPQSVSSDRKPFLQEAFDSSRWAAAHSCFHLMKPDEFWWWAKWNDQLQSILLINLNLLDILKTFSTTYKA